jgi:hypothetical protein
LGENTMLALYTIIILALGAAAERLLSGESPVAMLVAAMMAMLLTAALWRVRAVVRREGRWQMNLGFVQVTLQSRVPPAPQQAFRHHAPRVRG